MREQSAVGCPLQEWSGDVLRQRCVYGIRTKKKKWQQSTTRWKNAAWRIRYFMKVKCKGPVNSHCAITGDMAGEVQPA